MKQSELQQEVVSNPLQKTKNKLYILTIQDELGVILRIMHNVSYEQLWLLGSAESKAMRGFFTIFDLDGREIDGNFRPKKLK